MRFNRAMRDYYSREMERLPATGPLPKALASVVPHGRGRGASTLALHLLFNGAAAILILLQALLGGGHRHPVAEALQRIDAIYDINGAVRRGLGSLPGILQRSDQGGKE